MNLWGSIFSGFRKHEMAIIIALLVGVGLSLMSYFNFNAVYENKTLDLRFMLRDIREPASDDKVIIVAIDDQSLEAVNQRWPWPRSLYAKAIDNLSRAGATVIAFDLIFSEPTKRELKIQDRILANAIIRSRAWIVLASKFYTKKSHLGTQTAYVAALPKIDPGKTHVGYVNYWADKDGILRYGALLRRHQNKLYQSFVLKILSRFYKIKSPTVTLTSRVLNYGPHKISVNPGANLLINYRGGPGKFKTISFDNIIDDEIFEGLIATGMFKNKIILIGPTFIEAQDYHFTPYSGEYGPTSGVEIHANVLNTILTGDYLKTLRGWFHPLIFLFFTMLLALVNVHLRPVKALLVLGAMCGLYLLLAIWMFGDYNLVVPVFNVILALFLTHLGIMIYLLLTEELHSRHIKNMFSRYVSPKVVEELVKDPYAELKLGGKKQVVTVLFSDIRGFTTLSEELAPEVVVELLNEYFQTWTDVIFQHDGMVDKFIGDAIMAIFGAPVAHPDDPLQAVQAALAMQAALKELNGKWTAESKRTFKIGVGINTGEAIVGNMGSQQAMGYTVIGDAVNLASRLEGKTKDLNAEILISESTYQAVKNKVEVREHQDITVKGKARAMSVYEVRGLKV